MAKSEWCPICGSPDTRPVDGFVLSGDKHEYRCEEPDCGHVYTVTVPEPPDNYEGDGVFAPNH